MKDDVSRYAEKVGLYVLTQTREGEGGVALEKPSWRRNSADHQDV